MGSEMCIRDRANALKNSDRIDLTKEQIMAGIEKAGKGADIRGEVLTLGEFARLSNELHRIRGNQE